MERSTSAQELKKFGQQSSVWKKRKKKVYPFGKSAAKIRTMGYINKDPTVHSYKLEEVAAIKPILWDRHSRWLRKVQCSTAVQP